MKKECFIKINIKNNKIKKIKNKINKKNRNITLKTNKKIRNSIKKFIYIYKIVFIKTFTRKK